eukprot:Rmarinus@m.6153
MRPIMLQGHTRPLTFVKFNREGDLVFTAAKDKSPCVWWVDSGERIGTYDGHNGAVWCLDVNWDTTRLVTGSADNTVRIWDCQSGKSLYTLEKKTAVRSIQLSPGDRLMSTVTTSHYGNVPKIELHKFAENTEDQNDKVIREMALGMNIVHHIYDLCGRWIVICTEDGSIRKYDVETGQEIAQYNDHEKTVNSIQLSEDGCTFVSASADTTARLFDLKSMECVKTYRTNKPVNAASLSPLMDHVIVGGGQAAADVTTTHQRAGHFAMKLFHKVFEDEIGSIKGHFGPVNALAFSPNGRSFISGGEDGFARLHHLDPSYFQMA